MATYNYSDIDIELTRDDNTGDIVKDQDIDAIINSISNIMQTSPGSRRMIPEFANNPDSLLFDPIDEITAKKIGDITVDSIELWDDRVYIRGLDIQPISDKNMYACRLKMIVKSNNKGETLDFILRS
jgi:phage baseplate assembly protein W